MEVPGGDEENEFKFICCLEFEAVPEIHAFVHKHSSTIYPQREYQKYMIYEVCDHWL